MNISAISAYSAKTSSKPISFGKVNNIHTYTIDEDKDSDISEGYLTINGVKGHWLYYIGSEERISYPVGKIIIEDSNNKRIVTAKCYFPDKNLLHVKISDKVDIKENAFDGDKEKVKTELMEDIRHIIYHSTADMTPTVEFSEGYTPFKEPEEWNC